MAPTRPRSPPSRSAQSANSSPGSSSTTSSGVVKAGRHKNQWPVELLRRAARLYLFTTLSQVEICEVLGHGYCKSDNERRIRELFLKDEVPSRSRWCKHNAAGHQRSIAHWDVFEQYKVQPWRKSRNPIRHSKPTTPETAESSEGDVSVASRLTQDHLLLHKQAEDVVMRRINQFGQKYRPAHLKSVAKVYCHSITSTVRSSWVSLTSTFQSSETSSVYRPGSTRNSRSISSRVESLGPTTKRYIPKLQSLSKEEQWAWNILVDEDQLGGEMEDNRDPAAAKREVLGTAARNRKLKLPPSSIRPFEEPEYRPCGGQHTHSDATSNLGMGGANPCTACGCSTLREMAHLVSNRGQLYATLGFHDLNKRDFYDNTLLFDYINSVHFTVDGLKKLVANGGDIMVQNSSGASFMHYFFWLSHRRRLPKFDDHWNDLIDLVEFLAAKDFEFSHRNEHGQTVAHVLFEQINSSPGQTPPFQRLDRLLTALNTDIDALDNQGYCIGQYLDLGDLPLISDNARMLYDGLIAKMTRASSLNSGNLMLDFKKTCSSNQRINRSWPTIVEKLGYSCLIDAKGDSPLIAMLKVWEEPCDLKDLPLIELGKGTDEPRDINNRTECVRKLLRLGTGIDLKDRRGNTALVIAARRGFRATVEQLLEAGANPNTVNYSGRSVLFMAKGWLKMAKRMSYDGQHYARIASCIPVLQQAHAVFEPSRHQQLLSATARRKLGGVGEL